MGHYHLSKGEGCKRNAFLIALIPLFREKELRSYPLLFSAGYMTARSISVICLTIGQNNSINSSTARDDLRPVSVKIIVLS